MAARCGALLAAIILLIGCSPTSFLSTTTQNTTIGCRALTAVVAPATGLMVQPDDGVQALVRELDAARCRIDLSVYLLSDETVIAALEAAHARGVGVRVTLEEFPFGGGGGQAETRSRLEDAGIEVRWSSYETRFSHAKYLVIDGQVAIIMNQNLTSSAFTANREFAVITTEPEVVQQAQQVFDRDWEHRPIDDPAGPLILSPSNSRARMLALIAGAGHSIDMYAEVIRDPEIVAALQDAAARGVAVRLIVDQSIDVPTQELLVSLFDAGVEVRIATALYIHAKLMLIDGDLAIVGSQNPTSTSLDQNREVSMVVSDRASVERGELIFERDWLRATPGAPT